MSVIVHVEWNSFLASDDDPLPAIEGLQISGEAFPGQELQACGYSINGTTSCNFEVHLCDPDMLPCVYGFAQVFSSPKTRIE